MQQIFISYRRTDNADAAGRIYDRLKNHFGEQNIFKDVDSIQYGSDFRKRLSDVVASCQVFLAVMGVNWIDSKDDAGKRRLDSPNDFVRIEIESALARDIPLIPVLVANAKVPTEDKLPPSIAALSYRHAIEVRPDPDFHRDMDRLVNTLRDMLHSAGPSHRTATPRSQTRQVEEPSNIVEPQRESSMEQTMQSEGAVAGAELLTEDIETVAAAIRGLKTERVDFDVPNVALVARQIHTRFMGKEILAICELLLRPGGTDIERYKLIKVLAISIRQLQSKSFVGQALDTLIDYGVIQAALQRSALEAFAQAPVPPGEKWVPLVGNVD